MYEFDALVIIGTLGVLSSLVGLLVEVSKELPGIKRLPTKLYALIVSILVCQLALWIYASFVDVPVNLYSVLLAFFSSLVVSTVTVYGRDMLREICDRFRFRGFYSKYKR